MSLRIRQATRARRAGKLMERMERIQKILSRAGVASRRAAEDLIREGRVRLNGKVVEHLGTRADPVSDKLTVDGRPAVRVHAVRVGGEADAA